MHVEAVYSRLSDMVVCFYEKSRRRSSAIHFSIVYFKKQKRGSMQIAQLHTTRTAEPLSQFTVPQLHHLSFQSSTLYPPSGSKHHHLSRLIVLSHHQP